MKGSIPDRAGEVERRLSRIARRLGFRDGLRVAAATAPWLILALVALVVAGRYGLLRPALLPAALGGLAVLLVASAVASFLAIPDPASTALAVDLRLGTREIVTAGREAGPAPEHPLWRQARAGAERALRSPRLRSAFPLTSGRAWRATLLGLIALSLAPWIPLPRQPAPRSSGPTPAILATGEAMERELEEIRSALAEERPESRELMRSLEEVAAEMSRGEMADPEEALLALDEVETQVEAYRRSAEENAHATGVAELAERLEQDTFTRELGRALESGEREALRRALQEMADALPADEAEARTRRRQMESLADRLSEMASLLKGIGERELAEVLREAAEALREGDMERARELLGSKECEKACAALGGEGSGGDSELARDLQNLLAEARWMLGQETPPPLERPDASGQMCSESEPCIGGGGPNPGTGTTNEASGGYLSGDPLLRDRLSEETSRWQEDYEALYESQLEEAGSWEEVRASGKVGERGEVLSETGLSLGLPGEASVPLRPIDAPAGGAPEGAADLERVPPGYRDLVRRYFQRGSTSQEKAP